MTLGIIGAMQEEIELLLTKVTTQRTVEKAGLRFYVADYKGLAVVIVKSGIGKVNAALCAQLLISEFAVDGIVNVGCAGGVVPELAIGDVVVAADVVEHDFDLSSVWPSFKPGQLPEIGQFMKTDDTYSEAAIQAAQHIEGIGVSRGRVASGDTFVCDPALRQRIVDATAPAAVEMEGAAIGHVCVLNQVPFAVIRSISDNASTGAHTSFEEFLPKAAANAAAILLGMLETFAARQ